MESHLHHRVSPNLYKLSTSIRWLRFDHGDYQILLHLHTSNTESNLLSLPQATVEIRAKAKKKKEDDEKLMNEHRDARAEAVPLCVCTHARTHTARTYIPSTHTHTQHARTHIAHTHTHSTHAHTQHQRTHTQHTRTFTAHTHMHARMRKRMHSRMHPRAHSLTHACMHTHTCIHRQSCISPSPPPQPTHTQEHKHLLLSLPPFLLCVCLCVFVFSVVVCFVCVPVYSSLCVPICCLSICVCFPTKWYLDFFWFFFLQKRPSCYS